MEVEKREEQLQVGNEFALVLVRKVDTPDGERLEIEAPKAGHCIQLDARELETIAWQDTATFTRFLQDPFGPLD